MEIFWVLTIGLITVIFLFLLFSRSDDQIYKSFNLDAGKYSIISTDLGGRAPAIKLQHKSISGIPDAVFKEARSGCYLVGELKGRRYHGHMRLYEYYQLILYIGMVRKKYNANATGLMAYKDKVVAIEFNPRVFDALVSIAPEVKKRKRFFSFNAKPLHKRYSFSLPGFVKIN